jgi:hypothetical protein
VWVFTRPGVVRITICSCVRIGLACDSVQFIVSMGWIRFQCAYMKIVTEGNSEIKIAAQSHKCINGETLWGKRLRNPREFPVLLGRQHLPAVPPRVWSIPE